MCKILLVLDDIELIKTLLIASPTWFDLVSMYTYASVCALKCAWDISPYYRNIEDRFVREIVGRLAVLQFIDERKPEVFDCIYGRNDLFYVLYTNDYAPRELSALEWLIERINSRLDCNNPRVYFMTFCDQSYYDESIVQWLFKHRPEETDRGLTYILTHNGLDLFRAEVVERATAAILDHRRRLNAMS